MEKPRPKEEMVVERVLKSDGRYLIFYRFKRVTAPDGRPAGEGSTGRRKPERRA